MLFSELENDTFGLNQAELINEIKIKCSRFVDKMKIGCIYNLYLILRVKVTRGSQKPV
jgi:hypothetical protein